MARNPLKSRQSAVNMGQSSSQVATQLVDEPEAIDKQERRKKSKKRKEKRPADSGGHAEQEQEEEEIAQTLLEMKESQAQEDTVNSDENDIAAAHQLLAESSPARHGTSAMLNGDPVQPRKISKTKQKSKKNRKSQKDKSTDLKVGAEVHGYVEDLLGTSSRAADDHANGSQRDPQVVGSSSMAVPSLDDMDSNDENIAPYLREYDRLSAIAEPTTPTSHDEGGPDHERIVSPYVFTHSGENLQHADHHPPFQQTPQLTSTMGEKRKRKRRRDVTGPAIAITDNVNATLVADTEPTHGSSEPECQTNGTISLHRSDVGSDSEDGAAVELTNPRQVSPDLYSMPLDPVLPGIEDPTSPAYKGTDKRDEHQRKRTTTGHGDKQPRNSSSVATNHEPEPNTVSQDSFSKLSKKASAKRKRPVPADNSVDRDETRPKKKKRNSLDYKTAQLRKVSHRPVVNGIDEGPKEGPFTEAEIAKLFAFRDQYCEENDCPQQQFIKQIHANAHNNVKNICFWNEVSEVLPYRTRHALQRVCRRRFHNFTKRGTWTAEEDQELREAHNEHGNKWKVIGEQIERLPEDCRDRWRNYLKESEFRNRDEWTEYEVERLKDAVAECMDAMRKANREQKKRQANGRAPIGQQDGEEKDMINWVIVSEKLGGSRSRLQCSYKWKQLEEKSKKTEENLKKVVKRGPKKWHEWRKKRAEKKYPYMLPGDKYELLNALSQLGVLTDDSQVVWRKIGDDSFRSVWTAADCKYAYHQMKETISSFADVMPFDEIINTLKEQLEEEHPDELDTHWVPTAQDTKKPDKKTKRGSKSKKTKKQNLSRETVEESDLDLDNNNANDTQNNNSGDVSREQTPTATPEPDEADNSMNEIPDTQTPPEMEIDPEAEAETDSNPASSDALVTDDEADRESEPEPEIADSDQEGRTRTRTRETNSNEDDDEEEDSDVDEQLASKVMLLRNA